MNYSTNFYPQKYGKKNLLLENNITELMNRGKKRRQQAPINSFAITAKEKQDAYFKEYERTLPPDIRRKELELKDYIKNTIGSKDGFFCGKTDYKQNGIRRKKTWQILANRSLYRIQLNSNTFLNAIILDIDICLFGMKIWEYEGLPEPSLIVGNNINKDIRELSEKEIKKLGVGKCHYIYLLKKPVRIGGEGNGFKVVAYARAIQKALTKKAGADLGYSNQITKNPFNTLKHTVVWNSSPSLKTYTLDELAEYVTLPNRNELDITNEQARCIGRNIAIFDAVRRKAYRMVKEFSNRDRFHNAIQSLVEDFAYSTPNESGQILGLNEIRSISRSISKFCWLSIKQKKQNRDFFDYATDEGREIAEQRRAKSLEKRKKKANEKAEKLKQYIIDMGDKAMEISITDLSKRYKITPQKVKQLLTELGIKTTSRETYLKQAYDKRKRAFDLRAQGLKYQDIANEMGISLSHAKNLVVAHKAELNKSEQA